MPEGRSHHSRVCDDYVEGFTLDYKFVGTGAHALQTGEIELDKLNASAVFRRPCSIAIRVRRKRISTTRPRKRMTTSTTTSMTTTTISTTISMTRTSSTTTSTTRSTTSMWTTMMTSMTTTTSTIWTMTRKSRTTRKSSRANRPAPAVGIRWRPPSSRKRVCVDSANFCLLREPRSGYGNCFPTASCRAELPVRRGGSWAGHGA